ncbi:hypothetical protein JW710_02125 [Candidatus Dojkabacteria bacterium]|nr:hypothetical protein [Candidatus Dojkabacteria bacterium]
MRNEFLLAILIVVLLVVLVIVADQLNKQQYMTLGEANAEVEEIQQTGEFEECGFENLPEEAKNLPRKVVNPQTGQQVRWTGCFEYYDHSGGMAVFGYDFDEVVLIKVWIGTVGPKKRAVIWKKEVTGNMYAYVFSPEGLPASEETVVKDGLASLYLKEDEQCLLGAEYARSWLIMCKPVRWIPGETVTCEHFEAIHQRSLDGEISGEGIPLTLEKFCSGGEGGQDG